MDFRQLLAVAATASLLVPGTALAGKGNGKPTGKPDHAAAQVAPDTFKIRTLEGPETSPEAITTPTVEVPESDEVVAVPQADGKAARKAAKKAAQAAR